jgi:hypothetical protein
MDLGFLARHVHLQRFHQFIDFFTSVMHVLMQDDHRGERMGLNFASAARRCPITPLLATHGSHKHIGRDGDVGLRGTRSRVYVEGEEGRWRENGKGRLEETSGWKRIW